MLATPAVSVQPRATSVAAVAAPTGTDWKLYDQDTVIPAIVDAIDGAKHVVNTEFFVMGDAGKGAQLTNALVRAAERGVEVNVITDVISVGTFPVGSFHQLRRRIERAGGEVVLVRNPLGTKMYRNPAMRHVDHRKVVTVDSRTAFTGGMNFSTVSDGFHDSMVRLTGAPAAQLAADQLDRWQRVHGSATQRHEQSVLDAKAAAALLPPATHPVDIVVNAPEQRRYEVSQAYLDLIRGARERIWVTTPGLSDQPLIEELNAASKRGVDVRVLTGAEPLLGIELLNHVARSHVKELSSFGGAGYEVPGTIHRKVLVADDAAMVSSYNLTGRSRTKDHEVGVRSSDPAFVQAVVDIIEGDLAGATRMDPAAHRGFGAWLADLLVQKLKLSY